MKEVAMERQEYLAGVHSAGHFHICPFCGWKYHHPGILYSEDTCGIGCSLTQIYSCYFERRK